MSFGFFAKGTAGNLILGDDNKVLVLRHSADMKVTRRHTYTYVNRRGNGKNGYSYNNRLKEPLGYGFVEVTYPSAVKSNEAPYIFATPNGQYDGGGIGAFCHVGGPGNWTGFQLLFAYDLYYTRVMSKTAIVGQPTGWTYHLCEYGGAPSNDTYGLRIWNAKKEVVFDSGWKIVPFRQLLTDWNLESNDATRYYNINEYWGLRTVNGDEDFVYRVARHSWGYQNHQRGVLISSLQAMDFIGDTGDNQVLKCLPLLGFKGRDRTYLYCSIAFGALQHPSPWTNPISDYQILSADFSTAYKP